jgi:hypothetical protein
VICLKLDGLWCEIAAATFLSLSGYPDVVAPAIGRPLAHQGIILKVVLRVA